MNENNLEYLFDVVVNDHLIPYHMKHLIKM